MEEEESPNEDVRKVYISDSPVFDDGVEYNYVDSDIEGDTGIGKDTTLALSNTEKPPIKEEEITPSEEMAPIPALTDEDELALEAQYQKELQERLQNMELNDTSQSKAEDSSSDTKRDINEDHEDDVSLGWKDPPMNPFQDDQHDNDIDETKVVDQSKFDEEKSPAAQIHASPDTSGGQDDPLSISPVSRVLPPHASNQIPGNNLLDANEGSGNRTYHPSQQPEDRQTIYQEQAQQGYYTQESHKAAAGPLYLERQSEALFLQRNAPILYMQNPADPNEYQIVTPRDAYHNTLNRNKDFYAQNNESVELENEGPPRGIKAVVAPKPTRPTRNFLDRNKYRAKGQHSAKPGYSDRLVQKRIEQEQMKEWAPGMVLPRKKAASADDIIRPAERGFLNSAEDVWSKRSKELANTKQAKLNGKAKKAPNHKNGISRFSSDTNINKKNRVPPINQQRNTKTYAQSYQVPQGWVDNSHGSYLPGIPGTTNPQATPPVEQPVYYQVDSSGPQPQRPNIPIQYSQELQSPQLSPYFNQSISPTTSQPVFYEIQGSQGSFSGGYHHQPRYIEAHPNPDGYYQSIPNQSSPGVQQPLYVVSNSPQQGYQPHAAVYLQQQPQEQFLPALSNNPGILQQSFDQHNNHPSYDYSGYMNNDGSGTYRLAGLDQEVEVKDYNDNQPFFPPHPPKDENRSSQNQDSKKTILNPYAAIPPIHSNKPQGNGSYVLAYQREKEKAVQMHRGPTYKVYTMKDYKTLKLEYKLGGLGPSQDPELIKEKNEVRMKQLQYAKEAMAAEKKKPQPSPRKKPTNEQSVTTISGRQLAVEYAKHVPKPKVVQRRGANHQSNPSPDSTNATQKVIAMQPVSKSPLQADSRSQSISPTKSYESTWNKPASNQTITPIDLVALEDLQRRHEDDRRAVAEIQYKIQQTA